MSEIDWLETFHGSAERLSAMAAQMDFPWNQAEKVSPPELHNRYARALVNAYARKFAELAGALKKSIDSREYLVFALAGRSLIETTATLRYYVEKEYKPIFNKGQLDKDDWVRLINVDDRHLRGGRFDWVSFFSRKYEDMLAEVIREMDAKKEKGRVYMPPNVVQMQTNVFTCIEHWAKETNGALLVYNLFCELVHPNVGSSFLIASTEADQIHFGSLKGQPIGQTIVEQSLPLLGAVVIRPFGENLAKLMATIWADDEVGRSGGAQIIDQPKLH